MTPQTTKKTWLSSWSLQEVVLTAVAIVVIGISVWPLWQTGIPQTHDGEGHIARAANYAVALRQGQFPPRIAPSFWNGFTYPVFNFHYPLLSILTSPFILAKIHPEIVVKSWLTITIGLLSVGMYLLGQQLTRSKTAVLSIILIWLSPYFFNLLFVRGTYGEMLAYTAAVWLWFALLKSKHSQNLWWWLLIALSTAALSLAHNIVAMLLLPVFGTAVLLSLKQVKQTWQAAVAWGLGIGSTLFFWLPAVLEKKLTVLDRLIVPDYANHFPTGKQLLFSTVQQGFSVKGPADGLSFSIGTLAVVTLAIAAILLFTQNAFKRNERQLVALFLLGIGFFLWLCLPSSLVIWEHVSLLRYTQFPWRLVGPATVLAAILASIIWKKIPAWLQWIGIIGICFLVLDRTTWPLRERIHFPREYYRQYTQTSTIQDEMRPLTWQMPVYTVSQPFPIIPSDTQLDLKKWWGSYHHYTLTLNQKATIIEPTMYFAGWETTVDGHPVSYDLATAGGQLAFDVPAGEHEIVSRFTQKTWPRLLGNTLSLISVFSILGSLWWLGRRRRS